MLDAAAQADPHASLWCHKIYCYGPESFEEEELAAGQKQQNVFISLRVSQNLLEGGTGCHDWEAGFLLSEFILCHPSLFRGDAQVHPISAQGSLAWSRPPLHVGGARQLVWSVLSNVSIGRLCLTRSTGRAPGKRCVELGCGAGVVGVCLHRVGAGSILLTDGDERTVSNARHNLAQNGVPVEAVHSQVCQQCALDSAVPTLCLPCSCITCAACRLRRCEWRR